MEAHGIMTGGASSPTTSINRPGTGGSISHHNHNKRKRSGVDFESSPGSGGEAEEEEAERRRQPGVKRACNECRQQKLRCDVVQDPFTTCSRCNRLKLECKIESNFKRVGKRSKHAEMEKQIERLQRVLLRAKAQGFHVEGEEELQSPLPNQGYHGQMKNQSYMGSDEAVSSLLHLKQSGSYNMPRIVHEIENVGLTEDSIVHLFSEFFGCYHPYLPFLNPNSSPDQYYQQHPLLFWTIVAVAARRYTANPSLLTDLSGPLSRLLWTTVGSVPSNQEGLFVVKALCLLCTWPLPTSTTSTDPTHILCGVMMKTATGIGLHRPNYTQDFSRVSVDLSREQLHDRVLTWAVCNIVAQSIGTGYGQPASTLYDWALSIRPGMDSAFNLPSELEARLQIERFCDKVSKEMYSNQNDPRGVTGDEARALMTRIFKREYTEISVSIMSKQDISQIVNLHLKAAGLHLRLSAFFDSPTTKGYMDDLMGLWRATTAFLDLVFELESPEGDNMSGGILRYATNYILQIIIAASFTLFKLLSSFFAAEIDFDRGRQLFHHTIKAIRSMSIINNDLPWRLAEIVVQMWNGARVEQRNNMQHLGSNGMANDDMIVAIDDTLQLKTRCGKNPTNPESSAESSASSTHLDSTLMPPSHAIQSQLLAAGGTVTPNNGMSNANLMGGVGYSESNYEVFDPLNWMLDGLVDFPYSYHAVQGLEQNGMMS
ncbi:hypothetical protein BP5796_06876 [Coleophoma crateriformis]|uniref:Zn(2)-C6 fungal-type domain-containing protein n=1 Tax=Coleophoma crateriformis TaxID=565419 RepID=A0A3D8RPX6_9HELO|nr:hypothetical protein BP5796_06876 [Coleophoma crateriformis]